jgi:hypothetical protein
VSKDCLWENSFLAVRLTALKILLSSPCQEQSRTFLLSFLSFFALKCVEGNSIKKLPKMLCCIHVIKQQLLNYSPLVLSPGTLCTSFSTRGILIVTRQLLFKRFDYLIINFLLYELFHCSFGNRRLVVDSSVTPTRDLSSLLPNCSLPLTYHLFYP